MARKGAKDRGLFERPKGSGIWWVCYFDAIGRRHREKIGPKGLARKIYEKRKTEIREARYFPPDRHRVVLFDEIASDYLEYARTSTRTWKDAEDRLNRLLQVFGGRRVDSIKREEVEAFRLRLAEEVSPTTSNRHLTTLKATFNRACRAGKVEGNPAMGIKMLRENNIRVRCLSEEEERSLMEALPEFLRSLIIVATQTGMRQGELLSLRWEDVDFYSSSLHVRKAKGGEGRRLPMNELVRSTLKALLQERIKQAREKGDGREILSPYVFCSKEGGYLHNLNRYWYPALRRAGLKDFRFHDLRHTFASRLAMAGVDLYRIQNLLGHKTPSMVLRYAHLSPDHLRAAVELLVRNYY